MWREPTKAEANKTALEKDSTAAARSSIGRRGRAYRARRSGVLSSFHSQIIDELRRGAPGASTSADRTPARSPVLANGMSEDGMTLEQSRREAFGRPPHVHVQRRIEPPSRQNRSTRDQALTDLLDRYEPINPITGSFTQNFAPTFAYHTNPTRSDGVRLPPLLRTDSHSNDAALMQSSMPPDVRDYRSINPHTQNRRPATDGAMDGLGDRQRSPSPDGGDTDAWDTLLSTITPDLNLPSTDNSFASTSRDDSQPGSRPDPPAALGSSRMPRAHVLLGPFPDHLNPCDYSSSDDEDTPGNYHSFMAPGGAIALRRFQDRNSTLSAHPPLPTIPHSFSDHHRQSDEIQQMQVILDRLARRDDIPDDWWAAVGLARTLDRGLSASIDSTDTEGVHRPSRDHST
jgi:hypothetical protein